MKEPDIHVGILTAQQIDFSLLGTYRTGNKEWNENQSARYEEGKIRWEEGLYDELIFEPSDPTTDAFELKNVVIGIGFHWERTENQRFAGALRLIVTGDKITAINIIGLEAYLTSVISSEMSATASPELLKAHAVISRSWLLAQIQKNKTIREDRQNYVAHTRTEQELIRWYDREDHTHFDVCADDHCQRYQGITRASTGLVGQAIQATRGQTLLYDGVICDARFSKCCGGALEEFQYCWEDTSYPYLRKRRDSETHTGLPDLRNEAEAEQWIRTSPPAFCNTADKKILGQVLNNYDQETIHFYRWKVTYSQEEIANLIRQRSGIDYGQIVDLVPVERGTSGRLTRLQITGTKRTLTIGKELEIRRTLSSSHLYSSAFVVDKADMEDGIPGMFTLTGAGWGHGVGLCQIGAAMMGEQGFSYDKILLHYYIGATISKLY